MLKASGCLKELYARGVFGEEMWMLMLGKLFRNELENKLETEDDQGEEPR